MLKTTLATLVAVGIFAASTAAQAGPATLAAAQGNETAQRNRGLVAKLMTPAQIAEAQRLAREWIARHQQ